MKVVPEHEQRLSHLEAETPLWENAEHSAAAGTRRSLHKAGRFSVLAGQEQRDKLLLPLSKYFLVTASAADAP